MRNFMLLNFVNFVSFVVHSPLLVRPLRSLRLKIRAAACHFKKLRSKALSMLTLCCMPLLLNH